MSLSVADAFGQPGSQTQSLPRVPSIPPRGQKRALWGPYVGRKPFVLRQASLPLAALCLHKTVRTVMDGRISALSTVPGGNAKAPTLSRQPSCRSHPAAPNVMRRTPIPRWKSSRAALWKGRHLDAGPPTVRRVRGNRYSHPRFDIRASGTPPTMSAVARATTRRGRTVRGRRHR